VRPKLSSGSSVHIQATFCFIDLAGFTALTEAQGDEDAADVATRFAELARSALRPGDRLVKTIGDAVLITSPTPASGIRLVERLLEEVALDPRFPALRAGLHHGEAVHRKDDVFGAAVNLAARVAAEAHPGEVLGTERIADAAREHGIPVADLGDVLLKNVSGSIRLFSLGMVVGATDTPIDPVCRTPVDRRSAAGQLRYAGNEYWFCSLTCAAAFASNPKWHAAEAVKEPAPLERRAEASRRPR
jgi:class 3 adenylate cyclase/YHS domain-containing protein